MIFIEINSKENIQRNMIFIEINSKENIQRNMINIGSEGPFITKKYKKGW